MAEPSRKIFNVLFVCDDGAIRAPIAAAMLNARPSSCFRAYSAGMKPAAEVPTATIDALRVAGTPSDDTRPLGLTKFQHSGMPKLDFVFNLTEPYERCGKIDLPGSPLIISWPIPRPDMDRGSNAERSSRMTGTLRMIRRRVELFAELPLERLDSLAMRLQAESVHHRAGTSG